jgi:Ca2+-binding EF-hand superfamily protein
MRIMMSVGVVSVLLASTSFGQSRGGPGAIFDRADTNGDGLIAREEFLASRAQQFGSRDRNGDGFIDSSDLGERAAARPRSSQAMHVMMTQLDEDKNGKVSKDEFVAGGAKVFERADTDNSSSLDAKEIDAAKAALKQRAGR